MLFVMRKENGYLISHLFFPDKKSMIHEKIIPSFVRYVKHLNNKSHTILTVCYNINWIDD